jgi:hypothetical protein
MPSPRRTNRYRGLRFFVVSAAALLGLGIASKPAMAQITTEVGVDGRRFFVNAEPPAKPSPFKPRSMIYMPGEVSLLGRKRAMNVDRDGVEAMVREASERHHVDPALVRAVIETESNWNPLAVSRKGAVGLMQLIPTTAQRFGVNDLYSPQQNVDAGVKYLKTLLERYNGNLDLALAAYNAGEGAVDRAHGVPSYRETRNYVQRVQSAYFRPGSGRLDGAFMNPRAIRKVSDASGRTIFTND